MLVWLDGVSNVKAKPQENFARELMELFTIGVGEFAESDVYAAARVFTGWNLSRSGGGTATSYRFQYNANQHDTEEKVFTFDVYPAQPAHAGIESHSCARTATSGMQDGLDLIHALANHPLTARRLARRFWTWFVSETEPAPDRFVESIAGVYLGNRTSIRATLRAVLTLARVRRGSRIPALCLAGRVCRARDPRNRLGGILGERRAHAAHQHGTDALRAARCGRLGSGPRLVHDRRHARAAELRIATGGQPEGGDTRCARGRSRARRTRSSTSVTTGCRCRP